MHEYSIDFYILIQNAGFMAHTHGEKKKLLNRCKRIRGQIDGIIKLLEEDAECSKVLQSIAACRGATNGLMHQVLEGHLMEHVLDDHHGDPSAEQKEAAAEVVSIIKSYLK